MLCHGFPEHPEHLLRLLPGIHIPGLFLHLVALHEGGVKPDSVEISGPVQVHKHRKILEKIISCFHFGKIEHKLMSRARCIVKGQRFAPKLGKPELHYRVTVQINYMHVSSPHRDISCLINLCI